MIDQSIECGMRTGPALTVSLYISLRDSPMTYYPEPPEEEE